MQNAPSGEAGQAMFRAMKAEVDGLPKVGRSGRELGVRIDGPIRISPLDWMARWNQGRAECRLRSMLR